MAANRPTFAVFIGATCEKNRGFSKLRIWQPNRGCHPGVGVFGTYSEHGPRRSVWVENWPPEVEPATLTSMRRPRSAKVGRLYTISRKGRKCARGYRTVGASGASAPNPPRRGRKCFCTYHTTHGTRNTIFAPNWGGQLNSAPHYCLRQ